MLYIFFKYVQVAIFIDLLLQYSKETPPCFEHHDPNLQDRPERKWGS